MSHSNETVVPPDGSDERRPTGDVDWESAAGEVLFMEPHRILGRLGDACLAMVARRGTDWGPHADAGYRLLDAADAARAGNRALAGFHAGHAQRVLGYTDDIDHLTWSSAPRHSSNWRHA